MERVSIVGSWRTHVAWSDVIDRVLLTHCDLWGYIFWSLLVPVLVVISSATIDHLDQRELIVFISITTIIFQRIVIRTFKYFDQEYMYQIIVCETSAILFRPQCVNDCGWGRRWQALLVIWCHYTSMCIYNIMRDSLVMFFLNTSCATVLVDISIFYAVICFKTKYLQ